MHSNVIILYLQILYIRMFCTIFHPLGFNLPLGNNRWNLHLFWPVGFRKKCFIFSFHFLGRKNLKFEDWKTIHDYFHIILQKCQRKIFWWLSEYLVGKSTLLLKALSTQSSPKGSFFLRSESGHMKLFPAKNQASDWLT